MKNIIRSLMEPDPNVRPTAEEMLQKPFIKTVSAGTDKESGNVSLLQFVRFLNGPWEMWQ